MPALPTVNALYVKRIRDLLRTGIDYRTASLNLGSGTSALVIQAQEPGIVGNDVTVAMTVPGGTAGIIVTVAGNAISVALAVAAGVPTAANTATAIAAAINASAAAFALARAFVAPGAGAGLYAAAIAATALTGGSQGSNDRTVQTLPLNFLRAQDLASVLELFQDALDLPAALTATGGTTRSVQDTGAFVINTQVGNRVTFGAATTTVALRGVSAVVTSNTANELFFASLPATPVVGDTYIITGALVDPIIAKLRDGRGAGDSAAGNLYGDSRLVTDAFVRMTRQLGGTVADRTQFTGVTAAGSTATKVMLNMSGLRLRPDMFKNMRITIAGQTRKIAGNDDAGVFFDLPITAPASGVALTIGIAQDSTDADANLTFASGGQPANNRLLSELIRLCEAAVVSFTLPT